MKLINNHRQPITLDSGVILAAAGTPGSTREVDSITDRDRRRLAGRVNLIEAHSQTQQAATASQDASDTKPLDASVQEAAEGPADGDKPDARTRRRNNQ